MAKDSRGKALAPASRREMEAIGIKEARKTLGDLVNEAAFGDRIVPITRRNKTIGAFIGWRDLNRLRLLDGSAA